MTKTAVMKELRANGTAQNRKVGRRHGIRGKSFGVSYAALGKLQKRIKIDQTLAEHLWATGINDARVLATMIADPSKIGVGTLNAWAKDVDNRGLAALLSNLVAEAPSAKSRMEKWTASRGEMIQCTGWHTLASIARHDNGLSDAYFAKYLGTIESKIGRIGRPASGDGPPAVISAADQVLICVRRIGVT